MERISIQEELNKLKENNPRLTKQEQLMKYHLAQEIDVLMKKNKLRYLDEGSAMQDARSLNVQYGNGKIIASVIPIKDTLNQRTEYLLKVGRPVISEYSDIVDKDGNLISEDKLAA